MRNSNTKVRCEKLSLGKCPGVCRTYDAAVHKYEEAVKQITEAVICPRPMDR